MPNNADALKKNQFKPGQSGNKKGRPKLPNLTKALAACLGEVRDGEVAIDIVLKALRKQAFKGNVQAIRELLDRAYGKPIQKIEAEVNNVVIHAVPPPAPPDLVLPGESTNDNANDEG